MGEQGASLPSGRKTVTQPPSGAVRSSAKDCVRMGSTLPVVFAASTICPKMARPLSEAPRRHVTQTLPLLSTASPLGLKPVLKVSTLLGLGSDAGKRHTQSPMAFPTQIRSCWSIARWNGPASLPGFSLGLPVLFTNSKPKFNALKVQGHKEEIAKLT